jgi:N-methylhydantoinase B
MLKSGDRLTMRFGGGAGYGNPHERDPEAIRRDVEDGYVSREAALRDYGIELA